MWAMREVLLLFEEVSGLKVNFHKSLLTRVNIIESWLTEAASIMNCRRGTIPFVYLGLPIGGDSRRLSFWNSVVDRIVDHLSSWKNNFLSIGSSEVCHVIASGLLSLKKAPASINFFYRIYF